MDDQDQRGCQVSYGGTLFPLFIWCIAIHIFQQSARIILVSWWNNELWSFILKLLEYLSRYYAVDYAVEGASYH